MESLAVLLSSCGPQSVLRDTDTVGVTCVSTSLVTSVANGSAVIFLPVGSEQLWSGCRPAALSAVGTGA